MRRTPLAPAVALALAVAVVAVAACGKEAESAPPPPPEPGTSPASPAFPPVSPASPSLSPASQALSPGAAAEVPPAPPAPEPAPLPEGEEGLLAALADALSARDLARAQKTCAAELAADLRRIHDEDPDRFWRRGDVLAENVRSGLTIAHRQDDAAPAWRVLVRFGNGAEETVTFTRVDGKLRIDAL